MTRVFISYSRKDSAIADLLVSTLEQRGADVFIDRKKLAPGQDFRSAIGEEIEQCDYFVIVMSQHAVASDFVQDEFNWAHQCRKHMIPVMLEENIPLSKFFPLAGKNHIELWQDTHPYEAKMKQLAQAMGLPLDKLTTIPANLDKLQVITPENADQLQELAVLEHPVALQWLAISPDGTLLAVTSEDAQIHIWHLEKKLKLSELTGHTRRVYAAAFSHQGSLLATGSNDQTIRLWERTNTYPFFKESAILEGHKRTVYIVCFSPDDRLLASASFDYTVRLWDVSTHETIAVFEGHTDDVHSVAYSPDGRWLASASADKTIRLWDIETRQSIATLTGHENKVESVVFSSDGRFLASASRDGTVRLWNVAQMQPVAILKGHSDAVAFVSLSSDDKLLVSGGRDNMIRIWDAAKRTELVALSGHDNALHCAKFSPDGRLLISGSADTTVRLWGVPE